MYYISGMSAGFHGVTLVMDVTYQNRDVPLCDIHTAESEDEIIALLDRYIGNFHPSVTVICKDTNTFNRAFERFHETESVRHPNLLSTSGSSFTHSFTQSTCFATVTFKYRIEKTVLHKHKLDVDIEVKKLCRTLFFSKMPEEVKILIAHNYLAQTVEYVDEDHGRLNERSYLQSAYGALIKKECVCQGYAEAFKLLMEHEGIECHVVVGGSLEHPSEHSNHAWNMITLKNGNGSFHIDVTWDSNLGKGHYDYFCKQDATFRTSHRWNSENYPVCNSFYDVKAQADAYIKANKLLFMLKKIPRDYYL